MADPKNVRRELFVPASLLVCIIAVSCAAQTFPAHSPGAPQLKMQALVMDMADEYIASLGESVYILTRRGKLDSKGRWHAQSFLRNGLGASLDIAAGPNPPVSILDMRVLASLQTWSFEAHWIPAAIGDAGIHALDRLKRAEKDIWTSARKVMSEDQLFTVRGRRWSPKPGQCVKL